MDLSLQLTLLVVIVGAIYFLLISYKKNKDVSKRIFKNESEARTVFRKLLLDDIYAEAYYTIKIFCTNCRIKGTVRLPRGLDAEGTECPKCSNSSLKILGPGRKIIIYTPTMSETILEGIEGHIDNMIEEAISTGRIKRGGVFDN